MAFEVDFEAEGPQSLVSFRNLPNLKLTKRNSRKD